MGSQDESRNCDLRLQEASYRLPHCIQNNQASDLFTILQLPEQVFKFLVTHRNATGYCIGNGSSHRLCIMGKEPKKKPIEDLQKPASALATYV
jgi:hypothetical protein